MIKLSVFAFIVLLPLYTTAQTIPGMDPSAFAKMEEMEKCMEKLDESQLKVLQSKAEAFKSKIDALCAAGKRDQAQSQAMTFAKELNAEPVVKEFKKCSEIVKGLLPEMPFTHDSKELASKHICDETK